MQIVDLLPDDADKIEQVAQMLVDNFQLHHPDAWPNIESARLEVYESLASDRISRIAVDEQGNVLGWIGGIPQYNGYVWELHPLVVKQDFQQRGIGRSLVADLEIQVRQRGGLTLWVGTDDENNQTTLSGVDLYPNVWEKITSIQNLNRHPYEFYQKVGFVIVGVMPDANGVGKPDIYLAKRIQPKS